MANRDQGSANGELGSANAEEAEHSENGREKYMVEKDDELPGWIESRIDTVNFNKDLTQRAVALEFYNGGRPYYNVTKMHAALGGEVSRDTVQERMKELVERDVLVKNQINNGDIYWLDREESEWPIPPDVEVEPERTEPTISEWRKQDYVRVAAFSVALAIVGTAIVLIGTFQAGGFYQLPFNTENILAIGLTAGIVSYFGLLMAGLIWILE